MIPGPGIQEIQNKGEPCEDPEQAGYHISTQNK
jgi:hypothetical protein